MYYGSGNCSACREPMTSHWLVMYRAAADGFWYDVILQYSGHDVRPLLVDAIGWYSGIFLLGIGNHIESNVRVCAALKWPENLNSWTWREARGKDTRHLLHNGERTSTIRVHADAVTYCIKFIGLWRKIRNDIVRQSLSNRQHRRKI